MYKTVFVAESSIANVSTLRQALMLTLSQGVCNDLVSELLSDQEETIIFVLVVVWLLIPNNRIVLPEQYVCNVVVFYESNSNPANACQTKLRRCVVSCRVLLCHGVGAKTESRAATSLELL